MMKIRKMHHRVNREKQHGAILIAVLAILITLTLLGLAGMRSTTLEERMAGNFQEKYLAFNAAEKALRVGEQKVLGSATRADLVFGTTTGTYAVTSTSGAQDPKSVFAGSGGVFDVDSSRKAQYYIEKLPEFDRAFSSELGGFPSSNEKVKMFRVTARGYGLSNQTEVIIQTTVAL